MTPPPTGPAGGPAAVLRDGPATELLGARTLRCATLDADGWPHVVPLWFVVLDEEVWVSTLDRSAKVRHLERDPRATLLLDAGEHLLTLHGLLVRATATVHRDPATVARVNTAVFTRYRGSAPDGFDGVVAAQDRVAVRFTPLRVTTWDNRVPPTDREPPA